MKKIIPFFIFSLLGLNSFAQSWYQKVVEPGANFYDIQKSANRHFREKIKEDKERAERLSKGKSVKEEQEGEEEAGYEQYKRWEWFMEPRVYPSGDLHVASQTWNNYEQFLMQNAANKSSNNLIASTTWTPVGPFGPLAGSAGGQLLKSGRINFITIHPAGSNTLYIGAPAGGLWKSTNGGASWTTNTDLLQVIGCSDLVIDPTNPQIMYLATGDGDAGDTYSIGVLKSTDGGVTWVATGMVWTVNQGRVIRKLIIDPTNPQVVIAATNVGIWRTANGGTNWTQVLTTSTHDLEFMPGNSNTVYASGTTFRISTNNGVSWTTVSAGIPTTGCDRMAIAVTPADPNYVYVLAGASSNSGFQGFYRSTNQGVSFTTMATTPNLLGWNSTGSDTGGQSWYDLATAASPLNKDEVVVGGVNVWRSTDGGTTWAIYGHWTGTGAPFTHADQHDLQYDATGTLFNTNDGTVYRRTATAWTEISGTINISEIYKIGTSALTANYWLTGHQDNGTSWWNGTTYQARMGGDGMDCWIDRTNNANMFASYYSGQFQRSTNTGASWSSAQSGMSGSANWVAPWKQDPQVATSCWAGRQQMFKSTNNGMNWTATTGSMTGTSTIVEFAVAPTNNQIVYVIKGTAIWRTTDGGATWTNITGTVPTGSGAPTFITVSPTDANKLWVTLSGYSSGNKVFMSTNGGTSWTNYTSNLPNLPANCSVYQSGSNDLVYVGMDVGVYYRDNTMSTWTLYNAGLPNMPIADMEISPANPTKLIAASFGRGVWMVDVISAAPPASSFSVAASGLCSGQNVVFTDQSSNAPTSWSWSVSPSAGVTITTPTLQNPTMNFSSGGSYTVTLTASNGAGPGTPFSQAITITATPTVNITSASQTVCAGSPVTFSASGATTYSWSSGGTLATQSYTPASSTVYTVTGTTSGCSSSKTASVTVNALPTVSVSGVNAICIGSSALLTGSGASTYTWSTGPNTSTISVSPTVTTTYSVVATGTNGCNNTSTKTVTVNPLPTINTSASSSTICLGSNASLIANGASSYTWMPGSLTGATVTASPTVNTTYTVSGTDVNGCSNTAVSAVTVNPLPSVTIAATTSVVCAGQSSTLTGSGATSYTWMPGSITGNPIAPSPTVSTTYTLIGMGSNGCTGQAVRTISVNPSPTVSVNTATICSGSTATLTASGATTYSWSTGSTATSINPNPTSTTVYTVTGTTSGCTNIKTTTVTVNPNPTVTVNSSTICSGSTATLTASGANTYSWSTGSTATSINPNPTATTVYTVTGTTSGCTNIKTATVNVNPSPTVTVNSSTICSGSTATLTANGATTYSWSTGSTATSINPNPTATTIYTVTGTTSGCTSINTTTVTVNPNPTVTVNSSTICSGSTATLTASGASTYSWSTGSTASSINPNPTATTVYSVTGTTSGCTNVKTTTVTVTPNPTVSINSATICIGNSANLTASGASTYSWSTGAGTSSVSVSPTATTVYTVTGNNGTCTDAKTTTVTVNALPSVSLASSSPTACTASTGGVNLTLTGSPSGGIYSGTGVVGNTFMAQATSGTYTAVYSYTDATTGCSNTSNTNIVVAVCTGIKEMSSVGGNYYVFPNPTNGLLTINSSTGISEQVQVEVVDGLGKVVQKYSVNFSSNSKSHTINISELANGMYFIKVIPKDGKEELIKVIKE